METSQTSIGIDSPVLPKGGGAIRGLGENLGANEFNGTSGLEIPVAVSPARGFEPDVNVQYSSGGGNGVFGLGFSLSIDSIARKTSTGIPRYDDSDSFVLGSVGELVAVKNGERNVSLSSGEYRVRSYRPRLEGNFARIEFWIEKTSGNSHWRIIHQSNVSQIFGADRTARVQDPENSDRVFQWLLQESFDAHGNHIRYEYKVEDDRDGNSRISEEEDRDHSANRHLERIRYGNTRPLAKSEWSPVSEDNFFEDCDWHYEIVFDYGEYDREASHPYEPVAPWSKRPDSFSSYRSGFEVRTNRLCHRILMFHRFEHLNDGQPILVSATEFAYESEDSVSLLKSVTRVGFRDGKQKTLPSLELSYTSADPSNNRFQPVELELSRHSDVAPDDPQRNSVSQNFSPDKSFTRKSVRQKSASTTVQPSALVDQIQGGPYQMVDLIGEGLPGILFTGRDAVRYWHPLGNGRYDPAETLGEFPIERDLQNARYSLTDLDGDGILELLVTSPERSGFYEKTPDGGWSTYQSLSQIPLELFNPLTKRIDVSCSGKTDLLVCDTEAVKIYPSNGKSGYEPAERISAPVGMPIKNAPSPNELVCFADLFGDGGNHMVSIKNGSVDCWPNLGHGKFGNRVQLKNAPHFADDFDVSRLLLADLDGNGCSDLIYVHCSQVDVYRNLSGNGFAPVESITLPAPFHDLSQISTADVLGNGTSCLVFTTTNPDLSLNHQYLDFTTGLKPYLLNNVKNNLGAETKIKYAPSTHFYLRDKAAGVPWITRLPFPVHVVESIESIDHLGCTRQTERFDYHHGYFDPVEREFRGFGRVDRTDTEESTSSEENYGPHHVPPVLTKTWYHTGAETSNEEHRRQCASEYFSGDKEAFEFTSVVAEPSNCEFDDEQLIRCDNGFAFRGQVLRQEVYALDRTEKDSSNIPYSVIQSGYSIRTIQPGSASGHSSWFVFPRETITYHYERNSNDPRIVHQFNLEVDGFGNHLKSCLVFYPRRNGNDSQPKQQRLTAIATVNSVINFGTAPDSEGSGYLLGVPWESKRYEIHGLEFDGTNPIAPGTLNDRLQNLIKNDLQEIAGVGPVIESKLHRFNVHRFEQVAELTPDQIAEIDKVLDFHGRVAREDWVTQARDLAIEEASRLTLLSWTRNIYWDRSLTDELQSGKVSPHGLIHHSETAVLSERQVHQVFEDRVDRPMLSDEGKYFLKDGFWWNRGMTQHYHPGEEFFLPSKTVDPFGSETRVSFDRYNLFPARITRPATQQNDPDHHSSFVFDYVALKPIRIVDINDNVKEAIFDPLGMVIATTTYGQANERDSGDLPIYATDQDSSGEDSAGSGLTGDLKPYGFECPSETNVTEIWNDLIACESEKKNGSRFLQDATRFYHYDFFAFQREQQPPAAVSLQRGIHVHDLKPRQHSDLQVQIEFSDGFGRVLQSKLRAGKGRAYVRNEDGTLCRGENHQLLEKETDHRWLTTGRTRYNNKGKVVKQYEPFYSSGIQYESEAELIEYGVTDVIRYDPLLRVIRVDNPQGFHSRTEFSPWQEIYFDENDTVLDSRFYGELEKSELNDDDSDAINKSVRHHNTPEIHNLDNQGRTFEVIKQLVSPSGAASDPDVELNVIEASESRIITQFEHDVLGREISCVDPRGVVSFRHAYDMTGTLLWSDSADSGQQWVLNGVMGKPIHAWDERGFHISTRYDAWHRPVEVRVQGKDGTGLDLDHVVEKMIYDVDEFIYLDRNHARVQAQARNLCGQLVQHYDQAGLVQNIDFDIDGNLCRSRRQFRKNFEDEANWSSEFLNRRGEKRDDLEEEVFTKEIFHDAMGRIAYESFPDDQRLDGCSFSDFEYHPEGWLKRIVVTNGKDSEGTGVVEKIQYNARGQRTRIDFGNGTATEYQYAPESFRLVRMRSFRTNDNIKNGANGKKPADDSTAIQDYCYTYDPVGNITRIRNRAFDTIVHNQQKIESKSDYTYDALYRLVKASGREQINAIDSHFHSTRTRPPGYCRVTHRNDAMQLARYDQQFQYDPAGNLTQIRHLGQARGQSWTRNMSFAENSNRGINWTQQDKSQSYRYDEHGNPLNLEAGAAVHWNYRDSIAVVDLHESRKGRQDREFYVYDSQGNRVRKLRKRSTHRGTVIDEKIYLGNVEVSRTRHQAGSDKDLEGPWIISRERISLQVIDDQLRVAIIDRWTGNDRRSSKRFRSQTRYQLGNHLGSTSCELSATGEIISYEEFFPFGGTSYSAAKGFVEARQKAYRYSGKELDDATGLYYYGARYYAPWLGRWLNPDPAGTKDGLNLYSFVGGNPVVFADPNGNDRRYSIGSAYVAFHTVPEDRLLANWRNRFGEIKERRLGIGPASHAKGFAFAPTLERYLSKFRETVPGYEEAASKLSKIEGGRIGAKVAFKVGGFFDPTQASKLGKALVDVAFREKIAAEHEGLARLIGQHMQKAGPFVGPVLAALQSLHLAEAKAFHIKLPEGVSMEELKKYFTTSHDDITIGAKADLVNAVDNLDWLREKWQNEKEAAHEELAIEEHIRIHGVDQWGRTRENIEWSKKMIRELRAGDSPVTKQLQALAKRQRSEAI